MHHVRSKARGARPRRGAQLTVRNVPPHVASGLRRKARTERKSLNAVLVEALSREFEGIAPLHHDLDHLAGAWEKDRAFDSAIAAQDRVDESMWR